MCISFSFNHGNTNNSQALTNNQTTLIGTNSVIINTENATTINGALIANITGLKQITDPNSNIGATKYNDGGNLTLNTNTITIANLNDYIHNKSANYGLGISYSNNTKNTPSAINQSGGREHITIARSGYDQAQNTKATIGLGTINVANLENDLISQESLANLNRDTNNTQQITDERISANTNIDITIDNNFLAKMANFVTAGLLTSKETKDQLDQGNKAAQQKIDAENGGVGDDVVVGYMVADNNGVVQDKTVTPEEFLKLNSDNKVSNDLTLVSKLNTNNEQVIIDHKYFKDSLTSMQILVAQFPNLSDEEIGILASAIDLRGRTTMTTGYGLDPKTGAQTTYIDKATDGVVAFIASDKSAHLSSAWNYVPGSAGFSVWHDTQLRKDDAGIINFLELKNDGAVAKGVESANDFASLIAYIPTYYAVHAGFDAGSFNQQQLRADQNNISKYDANGSVVDTSSSSLNIKSQLPNFQPTPTPTQKINILNPGSFLIN